MTQARGASCSVGLPGGVRVEVPPPIEKRIAIGGRFLEEVRIRRGESAYVGFPVTEHRGVIGTDGTVTVHAMMPSALQLFAEGRLPHVGGIPVEVMVGGRDLGPMTLAELRCDGESYRYNVAVLVFKRPSTGVTT
jgi:hypothetical protein